MAQIDNFRPLKTIFLFGAGASYPAGIPLIDEMTKEFFENKPRIRRFTDTLGEEAYLPMHEVEILSKITSDYFKKIDLEFLMSLILRLENDKDRMLFEKNYTDLKQVEKKDLDYIRNRLQSFIREKCESIKTVEYLWPLEGMSKNQQLKIFTLNYDGTIEIFCEKKGIKYTDGFDPDWNVKRFDDNHRIHLFKLHGSLYWMRTESNKTIKVPIKGLQISDLKYLTDEKVSEMMIYPAIEKNKQLGVYSWLSQKFKDELNNSEVCVIVGYSFRDGDIRDSVVEALSTNLNLWLVLVSPHASDHKTKIFSGDPEVSSRILTVDMGFLQSITDRTLNSYLERLDSTRKQEQNAWTSQSTIQIRLDQLWNWILENYIQIGHHDRVKWIVEELYSKNFTRPDNNFPTTIEGVVCSQSLSYAIKYYKVGDEEKGKLWKKIFVESCLSLEYKFFANSNVNDLINANPVDKSQLPFYCMDGGIEVRSTIEKLNSELKNLQKKNNQSHITTKIIKLIETLDFISGKNPYFDKQKIQEFLEGYTNHDLGIKKWSTEIANSLKV